MAELSPVAQAVLQAVTEISPAPADEIAAAALLAAADNLTPRTIGDVRILYKLLSIAEELEGAGQ